MTNGNFSCHVTFTGVSRTCSANAGASKTYQAVVTYTFGTDKMEDTQNVGDKEMLEGSIGGAEAVLRVVLGSNPVSVGTITITYDGIDFTFELDQPLILINQY